MADLTAEVFMLKQRVNSLTRELDEAKKLCVELSHLATYNAEKACHGHLNSIPGVREVKVKLEPPGDGAYCEMHDPSNKKGGHDVTADDF